MPGEDAAGHRAGAVLQVDAALNHVRGIARQRRFGLSSHAAEPQYLVLAACQVCQRHTCGDRGGGRSDAELDQRPAAHLLHPRERVLHFQNLLGVRFPEVREARAVVRVGPNPIAGDFAVGDELQRYVDDVILQTAPVEEAVWF